MTTNTSGIILKRKEVYNHGQLYSITFSFLGFTLTITNKAI